MRKFNKMKNLLTFILLFLVSIFLFTACDSNNTSATGTKTATATETKASATKTTETTTKTNDQDLIDAVVFNDLTVDYDGQVHQLSATNLPKGAKIVYTNNYNSAPGTYSISVRITINKVTYIKTATLTITAPTSVLSAEANQTVYLNSNGKNQITPEYTLNNKAQQVIMIVRQNEQVLSASALANPGVYQVELYAEKNINYPESNHVNVELTIANSRFNLDFKDKEFAYDNTEKSITLENVPAGYTVEYLNNTGIEAGIYNARAFVKDSEGNVVDAYSATLTISAFNSDFDEYLEEFFVDYLDGDQLSINILIHDAESFGFTHSDVNWYTYSDSFYDDSATDFGASVYYAEIEQNIIDINTDLATLQAFDQKTFSENQKLAYEQIESLFNYYLNLYSIPDSDYMNIVYVDQFGGYVSDFGTYMQSYTFNSKQDIEDVIDYTLSTRTAFPSYLNFVRDKAVLGYPLSDYSLNEMISYLEDVEDQGNKYFLIDIIASKIKQAVLNNLCTVEEGNTYLQSFKDAISDSFMKGVTELCDGLDEYLGKNTKEGYYQTYENGKDLYKLDLEHTLGIANINMDAYMNQIKNEMSKANSEVNSAVSQLRSEFGSLTSDLLNTYSNQYPLCGDITDPEEMVEDFLFEFAKTIVPELDEVPSITVKEMDDASAKVSNAVAYYMKSAVDFTANEYITLNPDKLGDSPINEVICTLAHEGYPGHLYAWLFAKQTDIYNISKILSNTAHGEGWATYVELKLYEYAYNIATSSKAKAIYKYLYADALSSFLIYTVLDCGINYYGWTVSEVGSYLDINGYSSSYAQEMFDLLIEMPAGYAPYGYGKYFFNGLHIKAQKTLGIFYDEIEFNTMILSKGWTSLDILNETYNAYMIEKCNKYNIAFTPNTIF